MFPPPSVPIYLLLLPCTHRLARTRSSLKRCPEIWDVFRRNHKAGRPPNPYKVWIGGGLLQGVFDEGRDNVCQEGTAQLQAGIGVDFDQPGLELPVDHEIHPKQLEIVLFPRGIHAPTTGPKGISSHGLHLRVYLFKKIIPSCILLFQIGLKLLIGQLIPLLIPPVVRQKLLNCIISEMHTGLTVAQRVLIRRSADVSPFEPVSLETTIDDSGQHVVSYIEFPALVQEGLLYVLLQDEGLGGAVLVHPSTLQDRLYLLQAKTDYYAVATVGQLAWLDDPDIIVSVIFGLLLPLVVSFEECVVFLVIEALLDMEGKRQVVEDLLPDGLVVLGHCVEQGLFIADYVILRQVVLHPYCLIGCGGCGQCVDKVVLLDVVLPLGQVFSDLLLNLPKLRPVTIPQKHIALIHYLMIQLVPQGHFLRKGLFQLCEMRRLCVTLQGEVVIDLQLCPDQICVLPSFGETPPRPSLDQTAHQLRIIAPTHKHLKFGIFWDRLKEDAVGECHLPQEIPIEIPLKRRQEGFGAHFKVAAWPLHTPSLPQRLPQTHHHLPQILLPLSFPLFLWGMRDSTTLQISGLDGVPSTGVDVPLDLRVDLDEVQLLDIEEDRLVLHCLLTAHRILAYHSPRVVLLLRELDGGQSPSHIHHSVGSILILLHPPAGRGERREHLHLLFLMQGPADINIQPIRLLPHTPTPSPKGLVQFPQIIRLLLVLVEPEGLAHALGEFVDFVLDDGELVGLVDVLPTPLAQQGRLRCMHNKIIGGRQEIQSSKHGESKSGTQFGGHLGTEGMQLAELLLGLLLEMLDLGLWSGEFERLDFGMVSLLVPLLQLEQTRFQLLLLSALRLHLLHAHLIGGCTWDIIQGCFLDGRFVTITQSLRLEGAFLHSLILLLLPQQLHRRHWVLLFGVWLFGHEPTPLVNLGFEVIVLLFGMAVALVRVRLSHQCP